MEFMKNFGFQMFIVFWKTFDDFPKFFDNFFPISPIQTCQKILNIFVVLYCTDYRFYQKILENSSILRFRPSSRGGVNWTLKTFSQIWFILEVENENSLFNRLSCVILNCQVNNRLSTTEYIRVKPRIQLNPEIN